MVRQQSEKLHGHHHKACYQTIQLDLVNFNWINIDSNDDNLEDIFVETWDVNDIGDPGVSDMRPDHASKGNEHAALHYKWSFSTVTQRDRRPKAMEIPI